MFLKIIPLRTGGKTLVSFATLQSLSEVLSNGFGIMIKPHIMETKPNYYPPQTDILEVKFEGMMCQSSPSSPDGSGEDRLPWEEL